MRILFAGTPPIAVPSLKAVAESFPVVGVLTAPDRSAGRGGWKAAPAVKLCADELGLPVLQPAALDSESRERAASLNPELLVVFAYGRIFGPKFLALFPRGGINMHPSALPRYRGPSPLTAAVLAGDEYTALTVQRLSEEMDAGDILSQTPLAVAPGDTAGSLGAKAAAAAGDELLEVIRRLASGTAEGRAQDHRRATYCKPVRKNDALIDWSRSARHIERMVRAYQPWPKAFTVLGGKRLILLESEVITDETGESEPPGTCVGVDSSRGILIQTGAGILAVSRLQSASRTAMDFRAFLNGAELSRGTRLGEGI